MKKFGLEFPNEIPPAVPSLLKCCSLVNVDFIQKNIELLFDNWPVALVADGCGVNKKAGEVLAEQISILCPTTRCSSHAATGSIRRLTTSKTTSVDEVVTFALGLKPILKHFKLSGKSSALLNAALEMMEMRPIKAMTWCPTRMCNLLECSTRTVEMLFSSK